SLDGMDDLGNLIDGLAIRAAPRSPLGSVYRAKLPGGISPFIPYGNPAVIQILDVGFTAKEPQELVNDRFEMQLFGGKKGEALAQVESHLIAECRQSASAGAVGFLHAAVKNVLH